MTTQAAEETLPPGSLSLDRESDCDGEIAQSVQLPRSVELRRKCNQYSQDRRPIAEITPLTDADVRDFHYVQKVNKKSIAGLAAVLDRSHYQPRAVQQTGQGCRLRRLGHSRETNCVEIDLIAVSVLNSFGAIPSRDLTDPLRLVRSLLRSGFGSPNQTAVFW